MRASRLLPILLVCAVLSACATSPVKAVYEIRAGYDATVLAPAAHYRQLSICDEGQAATLASPCAERAAVIQLQKADKAAQATLDAAEDTVRNHPTFDASAAIAAARNAVDAAVKIIQTYGLK